METLELTDAHRKTERFEKFLIACEADARSRLGKKMIPTHKQTFCAVLLQLVVRWTPLKSWLKASRMLILELN